jgi:hypothetical protein
VGNATMKPRKLRIAWTVAWGIVAVVLVALRIRSHYHSEAFHRILSTDRLYGWGVETTVSNFPGNIEYRSDKIISGSILSTGWQTADYGTPIDRMETDHPIQFDFIWNEDHKSIGFPHWSAAILLSIIAMLPWSLNLPNRFSVRALLIATTLVAVGLGLIVRLIS